MAWSGRGASDPTNHVVDGVRTITGTTVITVTGTASNTQVAFPTEFSAAPRVFCTLIDTAVPSLPAVIRWGPSSGANNGVGAVDSFWIQALRESGSANIRIMWIAIGPA